MSHVVVVENPRRRRRSSRRRKGGSRRRRRNPALATLAGAAGNPRRRRRSYRSYSSGRRYRRRRNPNFGAGLDFMSAAYVAGGFIGAEMMPGLIAKVWPAVPRTGITGHAVKVGGVMVLGFVSGFVLPAARRNQIVAGGLASVLYGLYNEYLAPAIGLSGTSGFVTTDELNQVVGVNGFVARDRNMLNGMGQFRREEPEIITG